MTEKTNEPRYPSFKGIMAAKKKPVRVLSLAEAGIDAGAVGMAHAASKVVVSAPTPPKAAGVKVTEEGEGGVGIAEFLAARKLL